MTRRDFAARTAAGAGLLGQVFAAAPSNRLTLGLIGAGGRGRYVLSHFLKQQDAQVVAVADCFSGRRAAAKDDVDTHYRNRDCAAYRFHEQVLDRKDIDAVIVATGDRWHAVMSVLAARAGKDVYCEKPISLTIGESRSMVETLKRYGTVWQCGTQRRSIPGYKFVADVVESGRIGKLHTITLSFGDGSWRRNARAVPEPEPPPEEFDYDRWLGQAPWAPYSKERVELWRLNHDTSAGPTADMGPHYAEFAQWVRGDKADTPVEYEGEGIFRAEHGINDIPYFVDVRARYADGMRLAMNSGPKGVRFDGDQGWIQLLDEGAVLADPARVLSGLKPPESDWKIMTPHIRDFIDCVRTRRRPVSHPDAAHRAHVVVHCAALAMRLGRKLRWDPETELFPGDDDANNFLRRPMRQPWSI